MWRGSVPDIGWGMSHTRTSCQADSLVLAVKGERFQQIPSLKQQLAEKDALIATQMN